MSCTVSSLDRDQKQGAWRTLMFACLVLLLSVPPVREFFELALPPEDLLLAAGAAAVVGGLAVEALAWFHARRFPTLSPRP